MSAFLDYGKTVHRDRPTLLVRSYTVWFVRVARVSVAVSGPHHNGYLACSSPKLRFGRVPKVKVLPAAPGVISPYRWKIELNGLFRHSYRT